MIEILKFKEINKGFLQSSVNVKIKSWDLILNKISIFNKNGNRWINFPQESYEANGEKAYFPLVKIDNPQTLAKFQSAVLEAVDKYCKENKSEQKNESKSSAHEEELPF